MTTAANAKIAAGLRKKADALEKTIDAKLNPAVANQNPTPRRMKILSGMRAEGHTLQKVQAIYRGLADLWEDNPDRIKKSYADKLRARQIIADVLSPHSKPWWEHFEKAGLTTQYRVDTARSLLQEILDGVKVGPSAEEKRKQEIEERLVGVKIPGFFPTPKPLIDHLITLAEGLMERSPGRILEPSAGKGDMVDVVAERYPEAKIDAVEYNVTLAEAVSLGGKASVLRGDFLETELDPIYDLIIMNPPFEKGQDMAHVQRAFKFLRPGGVLVSVMSEAPFFREGHVFDDFCSWLRIVDASVVKLEDGSFKKAFRSTGVSTRAIVVRKEDR